MFTATSAHVRVFPNTFQMFFFLNITDYINTAIAI